MCIRVKLFYTNERFELSLNFGVCFEAPNEFAPTYNFARDICSSDGISINKFKFSGQKGSS